MSYFDQFPSMVRLLLLFLFLFTVFTFEMCSVLMGRLSGASNQVYPRHMDICLIYCTNVLSVNSNVLLQLTIFRTKNLVKLIRKPR